MTLAELPLLKVWFRAPHADRWFGKGKSDQEIDEEYIPYIEGTVPIHPYIVRLGARPIGLICWERMGDFPELMQIYEVTDPNASNCDVIIGEADAAHRGLGPPMIRRFLKEIIFANPAISCCVIDPEAENTIAIRAYARAGFRPLRAIPDDGDGAPVFLMELRRDGLLG